MGLNATRVSSMSVNVYRYCRNDEKEASRCSSINWEGVTTTATATANVTSMSCVCLVFLLPARSRRVALAET